MRVKEGRDVDRGQPRASRTTSAPKIVMTAPAEMKARRRVVRFAAVRAVNQPAI